jgi:hypothetical protein
VRMQPYVLVGMGSVKMLTTCSLNARSFLQFGVGFIGGLVSRQQ